MHQHPLNVPDPFEMTLPTPTPHRWPPSSNSTRASAIRHGHTS
jgi:hypothetical protein